MPEDSLRNVGSVAYSGLGRREVSATNGESRQRFRHDMNRQQRNYCQSEKAVKMAPAHAL